MMGIFRKKHSGEELAFHVPDMHCENCERRVRSLVEALPGIHSVEPKASSGSLTVTLDAGSTTDENAIREALAAGGYPAD
jgi:copper chaperone CopZ